MKKSLKKSKKFKKKKMVKKPVRKRGVFKVFKKTKRVKAEAAKKKKTGKVVTGKIGATEIDELIERGRPRGFVTDNEILYYFPKIEDNVELLDEIYDRLRRRGIKVIETSALIDFSKDEKDVETIDDSMALKRRAGRGADVSEGDRQDAASYERRGARSRKALRERRRRGAPETDEGEPAARGFDRKALREPHAASFHSWIWCRKGISVFRAPWKNSIIAAVSSSPPTPHGGSARRSRAPWPTSRARCAFRCTWWRRSRNTRRCAAS